MYGVQLQLLYPKKGPRAGGGGSAGRAHATQACGSEFYSTCVKGWTDHVSVNTALGGWRPVDHASVNTALWGWRPVDHASVNQSLWGWRWMDSWNSLVSHPSPVSQLQVQQESLSQKGRRVMKTLSVFDLYILAHMYLNRHRQVHTSTCVCALTHMHTRNFVLVKQHHYQLRCYWIFRFMT